MELMAPRLRFFLIATMIGGNFPRCPPERWKSGALPNTSMTLKLPPSFLALNTVNYLTVNLIEVNRVVARLKSLAISQTIVEMQRPANVGALMGNRWLSFPIEIFAIQGGGGGHQDCGWWRPRRVRH